LLINYQEKNPYYHRLEYPLKHSSIIMIDKIDLLIRDFNKTSLENGLKLHEISKHQNNALVIMGHSGIGRNALFNDLDKLNVNDTIIILKKNSQRTYLIEEIYWHPKGTNLKINNSFERLYLITCDKLNMKKQLIISSKMVKNEEI